MDGTKIKTLRKTLGLTQEEFAHEIGVTFATVNRWENSKSEPSRLALRMLAALDKKTLQKASMPDKSRMRAKTGKLAGKSR